MPTPPHQDNFYFCFANPHCLTIWVALDNVDESNGCMMYMKYDKETDEHGNGEKGILEHEGNPHWNPRAGFSSQIKDFGPSERAHMRLAVPLRPGDAVVHHANTIHAGRLGLGSG